MQNFLILALLAFVIYKCSNGGYNPDNPPKTLPSKYYEEVFVNVYFYFPDGNEIYLGKTKGASSCGDIAYNYAYQKNLDRYDSWSYICCTEEGGSSCYRKIR